MIIFVATADQANFLQDLLKELRHLPPRIKEFDDETNPESFNAMNPVIADFHVTKLHGHMNHDERKQVYTDFREAAKGVLISTDVGSRGLDFDNVNLIVLLDPPETMSHYSNRVGRTARLASIGAALTFLHPPEKSNLEKRSWRRASRWSLSMCGPSCRPSRPPSRNTTPSSTPWYTSSTPLKRYIC